MLTAFALQDQPLTAYHHADRTAAGGQQARHQLADCASHVPVKLIADMRPAAP